MKEINNFSKEYPLYETTYGSDIPSDQFYVHKFDTLPSKYNDGKQYKPEIIDLIKELGFELVLKMTEKGRRYESPNDTYLFLNNEKQTMIRLYHNTEKKSNCISVSILFDITRGEISNQFDLTRFSSLIIEKKKSNISLVKSDMGHMDTEDYEIPVPEINIEMNYGTEFLKVHERIVTRLNNEHDKGIILFHGEPGTGKTSYIKYLTKLVEDKEILFIPPSMAESLSEPSIIPFLMDHKNSILIIEDAERVIGDREGNSSSMGVSNILNLTDGILGDCLGIQVIATFNMKREKIDSALLRKGRLIAEHKFDKLNTNDANNLIKHLGGTTQVSKPMTLADIYNIDEESFKTEKNPTNIGFKN